MKRSKPVSNLLELLPACTRRNMTPAEQQAVTSERPLTLWTSGLLNNWGLVQKFNTFKGNTVLCIMIREVCEFFPLIKRIESVPPLQGIRFPRALNLKPENVPCFFLK